MQTIKRQRLKKLTSFLSSVFFCLIMVPFPASAENCTVVSTSLAFGVYDIFNSLAGQSTGSAALTCTGMNGSSSVELTLSSGWSGSSSDRTLLPLNSTYRTPLHYNVYLSDGAILGDGMQIPGAHIALPSTATTFTQILYFTGIVPARQNVAIGSYSDSLIMSINY